MMRTFTVGQCVRLTSPALHADCDYGLATVMLVSENQRSIVFDMGGTCSVRFEAGMLIMQYVPMSQTEQGDLVDLFGNSWAIS